MPDTTLYHAEAAEHAPAEHERVTTPRGGFRVITADRGDDPDLSVWFEHGEWLIVTDGDCAYAIAKTDWRRPLLNQDHVRRANNASHFDAGTGIENDARHALARFGREFPEDDLTDEQKEYLEQRRADWRKFALTHYNEQCRRRADYMPVNVCGPARYPGKKMTQRADKILASSAEFAEKAQRFFDNTKKHLYELLPLEVKRERIRAGKWDRGETIPANDPHVVELLEAKIEFLQGTIHKGMPTYARRNAQAGIKSTKRRIAEIKAEREAPTMQGWRFDGGSVVANYDANRLQIFFDDKKRVPERSEAMHGAAFNWSRRNQAWQRQLTPNAVRAAERVLESLNHSKLEDAQEGEQT